MCKSSDFQNGNAQQQQAAAAAAAQQQQQQQAAAAAAAQQQQQQQAAAAAQQQQQQQAAAAAAAAAAAQQAQGLAAQAAGQLPPAAAGAAVAVTIDQLAQLIGAVRLPHGDKKLPAFSSGLPDDWVSWRTTFNNVAELKTWTDQQRKMQLVAAMEGTAVRMVSHVDADAYTWDGLLEEYGNHFLPAAQSHLAESQFQQAKQGDREAIVAYHTRLRELYSRAHPRADAQNAHDLINKFIFGLAHPVVKDRTFDSHPATYSEALAVATSKAAGVLIMRSADGLGGRGGAGGIMAITPEGAIVGAAGGGEGGGCFKCGEVGHFKRECPTWATGGRGSFPRWSARRGGRFGGRGGGSRGRFSGQRKRPRTEGRQMAAMYGTLGGEEPDENHNRPEPQSAEQGN